MNLWALVPLKPFHAAKTRLRTVLNNQERMEMSKALFQKTMSVLEQLDGITGIAVVSAEQVEYQAVNKRYLWIDEGGAYGLNAALNLATLSLQAAGAEGVLIIPADLPLLDQAALSEIISQASQGGCMAIAPDRRRDGTNALLVSPPGLITYFFGAHSFARHVMAAQKVSLEPRIVENEILALDLDIPDDLAMLQKTISVPAFSPT